MTTYILCCCCLIVYAYTSIEHQWEDNIIYVQHKMNEAALYILLVAVFVSSIANPKELVYIGWTIVGGVVITLIINVAVVGVAAFGYCKLWTKRKTAKSSIPYRR